MKAASMKANPTSVMLTESNLPTGIVFKNKSLLTNINCWHKFIVHTAENYPRNEVLDAVLDHVHPLDLIPVSFWRDSNGANFLARNCGPAIQKLCNDNLVVANRKSSRPFKLSIILKFATTGEFKIDVQKNILTVLSKRYDFINKTLNLVRFHEDLELSEFCPLSQPKIMFFVLHLTKSLVPSPEKYLMGDNRIKLLNPLEALVSQPNIRSFDLSNNLLSDINTLQQLKAFKLTELYLDGNPLCENMTQEDYVTYITNIVKDLKILDGLPMKMGSFPVPKRNYLCNIEALDLVNQFLEHYFFIYDSHNRNLLKELYDKNALFSLNSMYHNSQMSSASTRLYRYNQISRNIHKMANFSLMRKNLFQGNVQITNMLTSLPPTEHDPYTFTVDVISYTSRCVIFAVSGVFRETPETLLEVEKLYGFRKTFVVERVNGDGLCCIVNQEDHVYNALSWQTMNSFKVSKPTVSQTVARPRTEKEEQQVIQALKIITTLSSEWARKCLEECNYDLKRALILFVDLYKLNRIPEEGFVDCIGSANKKRKM